MSPILVGTLGGLVAAVATSAGPLPAMFNRSMSQRMADTLLGFAAGVMLSASYFSLILPGLEVATELYHSAVIAAAVAGIGISPGALLVWSLDKVLPHEHSRPAAKAPMRAISRGSGFSSSPSPSTTSPKACRSASPSAATPPRGSR